MAGSKGPRNRPEAIRLVSGTIARWMEGHIMADPRDQPHAGFTTVQEERWDEAWNVVISRLRSMGTPKSKEES